MKFQKSKNIKGWYGLFDKDEFGHPEEIMSMPKENCIKLAKDILRYFKEKQ